MSVPETDQAQYECPAKQDFYETRWQVLTQVVVYSFRLRNYIRRHYEYCHIRRNFINHSHLDMVSRSFFHPGLTPFGSNL